MASTEEREGGEMAMAHGIGKLYSSTNDKKVESLV
ncbi:hypothetical protein SLEP1_g28594 [Rubroshorea leprosula]|uniref:Uncharacterized protein n=1 Tax=Rubroshorea leprosula TaxID=152421 RepID=A0AAV5JU50_9ROSI|nr:hypothetical protein SLEP1_g28594 [Rubroshorea leprosula]